jgi:hypothetical protein
MQTLLEQAGEDPRLKSFIFAALAGLNAMAGDFEQARRFASLARATCEEFGWELLLAAGASQVDGHVELAAGEPAAAECAMRPGYEALVEMGEKSYLSTVAAMIAEALHRQGRDDEAEQFSLVSEQSAAAEDVASQIGWRGTRAKLLARRRQQVEAEPLAREALELALSTDSPTTQGDALMDLAEVLSRADRGVEVASLVDQAIELYEAKGDVTSADRARTLRARVGAV